MVTIQEISNLQREHEDARKKVIEASNAIFALTSKIEALTDGMVKQAPLTVYFPSRRPKTGFTTRVLSETPPTVGDALSKHVLVLEFQDGAEKNKEFSDWYSEWTVGTTGRVFDLVMSNGDVYKGCSPLGMVISGGNGKVVVEISHDKVQ